MEFPIFGCLMLSIVLGIMLAWAVEIGLLVRNGHYPFAILAALLWPLGLNVVLGTACWIGSKIQDGYRVRMGRCRACAHDLTGNTSGLCPLCGTSTMQNREL